jgi:hypothetical protein
MHALKRAWQRFRVPNRHRLVADQIIHTRPLDS